MIHAELRTNASRIQCNESGRKGKEEQQGIMTDYPRRVCGKQDTLGQSASGSTQQMQSCPRNPLLYLEEKLGQHLVVVKAPLPHSRK